MLVDLTPNHEEIDRRIAIAKEHDFKFVPQYKAQWKSGVGIYQCNVSFNFLHMMNLRNLKEVLIFRSVSLMNCSSQNTKNLNMELQILLNNLKNTLKKR